MEADHAVGEVKGVVGAPVTAIMIGKLSEGDVRWKSSAIFAPLQSEQCKSVFEPLAVVMRYVLIVCFSPAKILLFQGLRLRLV